MVADPNRPWMFLPPEQLTAQKAPKSPPRANKHTSGSVFHDVSATTLLIQHSSPTALSLDDGSGSPPAYHHIPDAEEETPITTTIVRPISSASLIRIPAGTDYTSVSTLHLHLLHVHSYSSFMTTGRPTLDALAQNYHDLSLLARLRWKLTANPVLPFHLAALEVMSSAVTIDESLMD